MNLFCILKKGLLCVIFCSFFFCRGTAQVVPSGFTEEFYRGIWNGQSSEPLVGLTFDPLHRLVVWTKEGKVFVYVAQTNSWGLMLDISGETNASLDGGLLGFVLDPNYLSNGFCYVYYSCNVGSATMGKVKRFKVANPLATSPVVDYSSLLNKTLIGESASTGIPITILSHMGGTLVFGTDGSLLVSTGDGAYYSNDDNGSHPNTNYQATLNEGVMTTAENIGANRSQMLNSHSGKILRIDSNTGDGLPTNPYFDATHPRSAQSRVWARGLRNPFRIMHIPLTGNHADDPGDFWVGDVGQGDKEEYNLLTEGGQNFGWPRYEGMDVVHSRPMSYWPISHTKPLIDYRTGVGRVVKNGVVVEIGSNDVPGPHPMEGNSAIAGVYYNKDSYPAMYKNTFFMGDASGVIYNIKMGENYNVEHINRFAYNLPGGVVCMAIHPLEGDLYYVSYGNLAIRRIRYTPTNRAPTAKIKADNLSGSSPIVTAFSAIDSYDLDNGQSLTYQWDFGDGSPIEVGLAPHHVFSNNSVSYFKVKLTVTDPHGAKGYDSVYVDINNTPPVIENSTIHTLSQIAANQPFMLNLSATVSDDRTASSGLVYTWKVTLAHNDHEHLIQTLGGNNQNTTLAPLSCEAGVATYWYKVYLMVMDTDGLTSTFCQNIYLDCGTTPQTITFAPIGTQSTATSSFLLNATASSGLGVSYYAVSGPALVSGNSVSLLGRPGQVIIRAAQHGSNTYAPAPIVEQAFSVVRPTTQQTVTFDSIPNKTISSPAFALNASSSLGLPIRYLLVSGPAVLSNNVLTLTGQEGTVKIRAIQVGSYSTAGAYKERTFLVSNPCPATLILSQAIISNTPINYQASTRIVASSSIQNTASTTLKASGAIELNPGFEVTGGVFVSQIAGCQ